MMNNIRHSSAFRQRGFALLLTLIVVLILSTLVIDLSYTSRVSATVAGNHRDSLRGYYLAKSGVRFSLLRLDIDKMVDKAFGQKDDMSEMHWSLPFAYPMGLTMMTGQLEQAGISQEMTETFTKQYEVGGTFLAEISDEASRININAIKINGTNPNGSYLLLQNLLANKLFRPFTKDERIETIINNMVDWMDDDNVSRDGGMENDHYQTLQPSYHAKNGPFFSIDELALVKKMTPQFLQVLKPFITVYPYSTTKFLGADYGKININTASPEVLAAIFDLNQVGNGVEEIAKKIVEAREKAPFKNKNEFLAYLDSNFGLAKEVIATEIQTVLEVRSDVFRIHSVANVNDSEVGIEAIVDRSLDKPQYYYWQVD